MHVAGLSPAFSNDMPHKLPIPTLSSQLGVAVIVLVLNFPAIIALAGLD
jgi:hypothetical protein